MEGRGVNRKVLNKNLDLSDSLYTREFFIVLNNFKINISNLQITMIPIIGTLIDNILIDIMVCCEYFPHYSIKASGVSVTHLFHSRSMVFNQGRFCHPEDIWQHFVCHSQRTTFEGRMRLVSSE